MFQPNKSTAAPRKGPATTCSPRLSSLSNAVSSALTGGAPVLVAATPGSASIIVPGEAALADISLSSALAEGLYQGAQAIREDVTQIARAIAETATKLLSPQSENLPPASRLDDVVHQDVLFQDGLPDTSAKPFSSCFDVPALLPDIDDHSHTGRSITQFVAPSAEYMPPQLKLPEDAPMINFARALLNAAPARLEDRNRLLRFYAPLPEEQRLYVSSLHGQASLSDLDQYTLRLLSTNAAIDLQDVLGKNVTTAICLADGREHPINGYVTTFGFTGTDGGLAVYQAEITPWLWYLTKRVNSRIYQDMTVLDVIAQVFADYGALVDYQVRVAQPPPVNKYTVQYHETDFHFISRLLEKYGLFYYFEHRHDGHTLIICDDSLSTDCCPPQSTHPHVPFNDGERVDRQDCVTQLSTQRSVQIGSVALNTYDYEKPSVIPYLEQPTIAVQGNIPILEIYDGNPAFAYRSFDEGNQEAKRRLESHEWQAKQFFAASECRGMCVGRTFQLHRHFWFDPSDPESADFLVLGLQIEASNNFERTAGEDLYRNRLTMIRRKIPYRPVQAHAKPVMQGPQSATVVGPAGQEIYTDAMGRIKVQFPWDRHGKFDAGSSCWIRVSQPWAGRNWGTIAVPRIGQEVIVDFFEGDPDRPVITGRLYNNEQTPPYSLPGGAHMMGFHSNSTPGGNGHCEMVIHDEKGNELVNIHSQKNMNTTVLNDQATTVRHDRTVTVLNDQTTAVGNNQTITVRNDQSITVGNNQTITVNNDQATLVHGHQTNTVHKSIVTAALTENIQTTAHTNMDLVAETGHFTTTAKEDILIRTTDGGILVEGKTAIRLAVGSSSLEMHADGTILISGKLVQIIGTDSVDLNPGWTPPVPEMPPGVSLEENIAQAKDMTPWDFYQHVKGGGPWDYKLQGEGNQYENFGNFNYGATGAAMGIPLDVLLRGAGFAQKHDADDTSNEEYGHWYDPPWVSSSNGDDPKDQEQIRLGYEYYQMTH